MLDAICPIFAEIVNWLKSIAPNWQELALIFTSFGLMSFTVIDANALYSILLAGGFTAGAGLIKKLIKYSAIQFGEALSKKGTKIYTLLYEDTPIFTGVVEELDTFLQKLGKQQNTEQYLDELVEKIKNIQKRIKEIYDNPKFVQPNGQKYSIHEVKSFVDSS